MTKFYQRCDRFNFGQELNIDYKKDFAKTRQYYKTIHKLRMKLMELHALWSHTEYTISWWHFEPYVEFTYVFLFDENPEVYELVRKRLEEIIKKDGYTSIEYIPDIKPGWYHTSEQEHCFEMETMKESADMADNFYTFEEDIIYGKGLRNQYVRKCHILANQLGLNYKEEGRYLFWRGILCFLFYWFGQTKAVWIYTKIFRQSY